mmetsp:Transcript_33256/g.93238  ORF Transcript_33256/g.93238 Transcript_33256/m.93238 type:complete len:379 (+) Transcript_33256:263-1399(+)
MASEKGTPTRVYPPAKNVYLCSASVAKRKLDFEEGDVSVDSLSPNPRHLSPSLRPAGSRGEYRVQVIAGTGNRELAQDVANQLSLASCQANIRTFADGEKFIELENNIRGADLYVVQPICPPNLNDNLMELLLLLHTAKLSSAHRVTAVVPYYGYARQSQKKKPRVPIAASAVAQLIEAMSPHRLVTIDLHCGQIQGFFQNIPVDNLYADNALLTYIRHLRIPVEDLVMVSPDAESVEGTARIADKLAVPSIATVLKRKSDGVLELVGTVEGRPCIIVDDMIDTGSRIKQTTEMLSRNGAKQIYAVATHGVLSGAGIEIINSLDSLTEVCVTDTICQDENVKKCPKLRVVTVAHLLAHVIRRLHHEQSLSELFKPTGS